MKAKTVVFVAAAILLAALFIRLGFWQLDRLAERRARNAELRARLSQPVVAFEQLRDTMGYRRATLTGALDHANEIVFTGRSRNGSPGVYILTPMRRTGNDTGVIVLRGWVYAADAATIDQTAWRESRTTFHGHVHALHPSTTTATVALADRKVRSLNRDAIQRNVPYPISPLYLVARDSGSERTPVRLPPPALDNGPHLSYSIQWFCFAAIAIGGAAIVAFRGTGPRRDGAAGA